MRYALEMDNEDRHRQMTGALDGLASLVSNQAPGLPIDSAELGPLLEMIAEYAHRLLDPTITSVGLGFSAND